MRKTFIGTATVKVGTDPDVKSVRKKLRMARKIMLQNNTEWTTI